MRKRCRFDVRKKRKKNQRTIAILAVGLVLFSQLMINQNVFAADENTVQPVASAATSASPEVAASADPMESMQPTESVQPSEDALPTESAEPTESVQPTVSAEPTESAQPTESALPTASPEATGGQNMNTFAVLSQVGALAFDAQAIDETQLDYALANATGTASSPYVIEIAGNVTITTAKTIAAGKYVKLISSGPTFTLTRTNQSINVFNVSGSLELENIVIDGNSSTSTYSLVNVSSGAAFTMNTGSVLQNALFTSPSGGAVYNQGTFNLNGGAIKNNNASIGGNLSGGVVYNDGIFNMTAGSIASNTAEPSGIDTYNVDGGMVYNGSSAAFTMSGGVIGGDGTDANTATARNGGALNGGAVYNAGSFVMNGTALIKGNKPTEISGTPPYGSLQGGAVYNSGTFTMAGSAEISGTNVNISNASATGIGVYSKGASALFTMQDAAKISGNTGIGYNTSVSGGGVYNCGGSQFTMQDHTEISGNQLSGNFSSGYGAGVNNQGAGSTFTMKGNAKISDNTISTSSDSYGAGVYMITSAQFNLEGGTISGNSITATDTHGGFGGGVYSYNNTTFNMSGGTITGNSLNATAAGSYCRGGGVFTSNATFTMSGGLISSNQANNTSGYAEGGGVFNWNIFNMSAGRITGNSAKNGGGVCNFATFNLSGSAQIDTNNATTEGGGVENTSGTFAMTGGSIADNTAPKGKGILNAATFNLSGSAAIAENNGVYLNSGKVINVAADLTGTSPFAIITPSAYSAGSNMVVLAAGLSADTYLPKFTIAPNGTTPWGLKANGQNLQLAPGAIYLDGQAGLDTNDGSTKATAVATLEKAASLLGNPGTIYICGTVTVPSGNATDYTWTLPDGQTVKRYDDPAASASDFTGVMVQVNGNLTLQNITIDGGWDASLGTGVEATEPIISESGTGKLKINAGAALQNNNIVIPVANEGHSGSGVQGSGSVTMNGGEICGNQIQIASGSYQCAGAGIGMTTGTLTINGGEIRGNALNATYSNGAGVYVSHTSFALGGGSISGNHADLCGGGIYVDSGSTFTMTGGTIGGSLAADANTAQRGGGLSNYATANVSGGSIMGNTVTSGDELGGGVFNQSVLNLSGTVSVTGNTALAGGGVYNLAQFNVSGAASIDGNTASNSGGGVCFNSPGGTFEMDGGSIRNNTAAGYGGGIYVQSGSLNMTAGTIAGNSANGGGGINGCSSTTLNISGGTISGNSVSGLGGGILNDDILNMNGGTITGNTASRGAGVYHYGATFNLSGGALIAQNNPVYLDTNTYITVMGALSNAPAAWVIPASYPDFGGSVKVGEANYTGATGADVLNSLAVVDSAYALQASGNDVNMVKIKVGATITLNDASATYTGSAISYPGSVTKPSDLNVSALTFQYKLQSADDSTYTTTAPTNAGTYSVKATLTGHVKYNDTVSNVAAFTINTATPALSAFSDQQADYTGNDFAISAPAVTGVGGSDISGQGTIAYQYKLQAASSWTNGLPRNAGVYNVKATYSGNANYSAVSLTNTVTIRKVALTATADNHTRGFGQPNPALTITYSGFVPGETASVITPPTAHTTATAASAVGDYAITLSGGSAANYAITCVPGTLTVSVASPTITFNDQSADYSGLAFAITAPAITENGVDLCGYGTLSYEYKLQSASAWTIGLPKNVGVYDVRATFTGNANITGGTALNVVTIRKAPLTVAANNITKVVGTDNPALTIAYGGFVNHEDASALSTLPIASTTATRDSDLGDYPITVSGGSAANYSLIYVPGTLTISPLPAAQTPVFTKNLAGEYTFYNHAFDCNLVVEANVSDNGVITYQWYKNTANSATGGTLITGATGDHYTVPADTQGTVYFYAIATNTLDANRTAFAASNIVKVTVAPATDDGSASGGQSAAPSASATRSEGYRGSESQSPAASQGPVHTQSSSGGNTQAPQASSQPGGNGQGNIKVAVLPATVDTPDVTVSDSTGLKDFALTDEDKAAIENGENITIILKVERVPEPVNQGDDTMIMHSLGGNTLGIYLDVELLKQIGESQQQRITNTSKPIRIVMNVPPELQKKGRNYAVIRVHDGETTVLPDLDDDPATITIETDRFSTYALVYKDKPGLLFWLLWILCILAAAAIITRIYLARKKKRKHNS